MAANYLPVLISSVNVNSSDDSEITTLPHGQVDYLSHEWQEEDVWRSWRNMTRQKNEIANGARLENASWRTWWKQRNGLKTVSPETLNWLKDSDVTWLYGPLHTAADHLPRSRPLSARSSTSPPSPVNHSASLATLPAPQLPKPILKHRSIGDLLSSALPPSPHFQTLENISPTSELDSNPFEHTDALSRPHLLHTKSDSNIFKRNPFRKESPPRIIADGLSHSDSSVSASPPSPETLSQTSTPPLDATSFTGPPKKHISFNTFVEQCIAIDKPSNSPSAAHPSSDTPTVQREFALRAGRTRYPTQTWPEDDEDEEESGHVPMQVVEESDDEDDQIEIRTARSRSSSAGSVHRPFAFSRSSSQRSNTSTGTNGTASKEHVTIAPIAPTMLKASSSYAPSPIGSSSNLHPSLNSYARQRQQDQPWAVVDEDLNEDVPLVWVPPVGSGYDQQISSNYITAEASRRTHQHSQSLDADPDAKYWLFSSPPAIETQPSGDYFENRSSRDRSRRGSKQSSPQPSRRASTPRTEAPPTSSHTHNNASLSPPTTSSTAVSSSSRSFLSVSPPYVRERGRGRSISPDTSLSDDHTKERDGERDRGRTMVRTPSSEGGNSRSRSRDRRWEGDGARRDSPILGSLSPGGSGIIRESRGRERTRRTEREPSTEREKTQDTVEAPVTPTHAAPIPVLQPSASGTPNPVVTKAQPPPSIVTSSSSATSSPAKQHLRTNSLNQTPPRIPGSSASPSHSSQSHNRSNSSPINNGPDALHQQNGFGGSLVEMVSSARGYLGSMFG